MRRTLVLAMSMAAMASGRAAMAAAACPNPAFASEARTALKAYVDEDVFSGAVLVAVDDQPVLRLGVGLADRELGVPNTPETKFRIGSITKQFTATAILQLAEQGKLSIDDPVSKYYAAAPASWAKVTIRNLLTHTSGIPSYTAVPGFDGFARLPHTPEELIKLTQDKPLDFEPGTQFAYDNTGYVILGYIIEKVSGQTYADYLQSHIFGPLGMTSSGYDSSSRIIPGRALGYERGPAGWRNAAYLDMSGPFSAGALYSDVDDFVKWDRALGEGKLLSAASLKAMFTDYGHHYGFGWEIDQKWGQDRIWHNGGINGFASSFQRYPKAGIISVALSNEMLDADKLAADLAGLCMGAQVYPKQVQVPANILARYAGDYDPAGGGVIKIDVHGDHLVAHVSGQPDSLFYPQSPNRFFDRTFDQTIVFETDAQGNVTDAVVTVKGQNSTDRRITAAEAERIAAEAAVRAAAHRPAPGSEAALRRVIGEIQRGQLDYSRIGPALAAAMRQQQPGLSPVIVKLGAIKSMTFELTGPGGADLFRVQFESGALEWGIAVGPDGVIQTLFLRPVS